jgi:hypothetical protein
MISTDEFPPEVKSYDEVALEYYDPAAHPTCKNFRDGSLRFLTSHLTDRELIGTALDVGAGSSILGEVLTLRGLPLGKLVLIDRYARMLKHSRIYSVAGAMLVMGDAEALPRLNGPYRCLPRRSVQCQCVLGRSCPLPSRGECLFTTPSYEWAQSFRHSTSYEKESLAYFELRDGAILYVPSIIYPISEQLQLCSNYDLNAVSIEPIFRADLPPPLSPKLRKNGKEERPVLTGYCLVRG